MKSSDMYCEVLKNNVKYYKETEGGRNIMCQVFEDYGKMREKEAVKDDRQKTILSMINKKYTKEQIIEIGFNEDEYNQAEASLATMA
jgi:hypothetical protein